MKTLEVNNKTYEIEPRSTAGYLSTIYYEGNGHCKIIECSLSDDSKAYDVVSLDGDWEISAADLEDAREIAQLFEDGEIGWVGA